MENMMYTLQDFMTHTKNITYLIMGGILVFLPLFWFFLNEREND